jgi:hypothetical protein
MAVDPTLDLKTHESPIALFEDTAIRHFDLSNPAGCAKHLISDAVTCSAKLNFALRIGSREGFVPLRTSSRSYFR